MSESHGPPARHDYPPAPPVTPVPGPLQAPLAFPPEPQPPVPSAGGHRGLWIGAGIVVVVVVGMVAGVTALRGGSSAGDQSENPATVASEISATIAELTATVQPSSPVVSATGSVATAPSETSVFKLTSGSCFDDPDATAAVSAVRVVPCKDAHDNEVFALVEYPAGPTQDFPGNGPVAEVAEQKCNGQVFTDYVGIPWLESQLTTSHLTPTDGSWAEGDREIVCLLYDTAPLTGTVRGSRQ